MRECLLLLCLAVALSGCTVNLIELTYTPPARPPRATPLPGDEGKTPFQILLERSRKETEAGTKQFVTNALIAAAFSEAVGLSDANCVQAIELANGEVAVDFGNVTCPADNGLLPAGNIVFTLYYNERSQTEYQLEIDTDPLGSVGIDISAQSATLNSLCTGDYEAVCALSVDGGNFSAVLLR